MLDDYSNASVGMDEGLRSESLGPESMAQNHWLLKRWESRAVSGLNLPKLLIVTQFLSAGSSCLVSLVCLLQSSPYIPLMWAKIPHSLLNSQFLMTSPPLKFKLVMSLVLTSTQILESWIFWWLLVLPPWHPCLFHTPIWWLETAQTLRSFLSHAVKSVHFNTAGVQFFQGLFLATQQGENIPSGGFR